jgi:hypothetical protein
MHFTTTDRQRLRVAGAIAASFAITFPSSTFSSTTNLHRLVSRLSRHPSPLARAAFRSNH